MNDTFKAGSDNCLPVGTRLADFEIKGVIGEGGFGIVYLAFDHSLQRTVAIKEYMPGAFAGRRSDRSVAVRSQRDQGTFETGLKSFINEARLLAQFDHPALIKVYRFWEENNTAYMAMRYYQGQTLKSLVRSDPYMISEDWLKGMLTSVLEALDALYRVNILHRDISPDNIMIQSSGQAVLLDFGAARQMISGMSYALTVILKPGFAPIEQYADDAAMKQGPWTDIYSLSAVVYAAITQKAPPTSVARMLKDPLEPLQASDYPGFSKDFLAAIDKGLAVRPEDRPQSIEEFRKLLQVEWAAPASPVPAVAFIPPLPADADEVTVVVPRKRSIKGVHVARIAFVLCGIASVAWFSLGQGTVAVATSSVGMTDIDKPGIAMKHPDAGSVVLTHAPVHARVPQSDIDQPAPVNATEARTLAKENVPPIAKAIEIATGTVKVNIKPWGTVFVDGVSKGVSPPLKRLALPEGKHQIEVVNPNFSAHKVEIQVTKNKTANIEYDFSRSKK